VAEEGHLDVLGWNRFVAGRVLSEYGLENRDGGEKRIDRDADVVDLEHPALRRLVSGPPGLASGAVVGRKLDEHGTLFHWNEVISWQLQNS
jgi:hypothetical protein